MFADILRDSRAYADWFEFTAKELTATDDELGPRELARLFCSGPNELDGRQVSAGDLDAVTAALIQSLIAFEQTKLISGRQQTRHTSGLRLRYQEKVAKLTRKGLEVAGTKRWRQQFFFLRFILLRLLVQGWCPFAAAVAIAGTVATVLKLVLLWNSDKAAIAAAVAGIATLVGSLLKQSGASPSG